MKPTALRYLQDYASPEGWDPETERDAQERTMDINGVPRSLQSQISPERAEEITNPLL